MLIKDKVPIDSFKRTKIIATVGPATNSYDKILDLIEEGANVLRLNFSHGTNEERDQQIAWIRKASRARAKPVAIVQDLQGPKIRLGEFEGAIYVNKKETLKFEYKADYKSSGHIPLQYNLAKKIKRGERLQLVDGKIKTIVTEVKGGVIHAWAETSGTLLSRKGINVPDTDFQSDIITTKDKKDLAYGSTADIDYVALSFVQQAVDIVALRKILSNLGSQAKIIAKIETKAGAENIEEIFQASDAVMVARGDLAVETSPESVPILQRQIIGLGLKYSKPTIVATQMLASMTTNPEPTRAEVSDVATAVIVGADAVMLSDETASGEYPIEAIRAMKRIVRYTEINQPLKAVFPDEADHSWQLAISKAIISLAEDVEAQAIVAETKSGATALQIASKRPERPIIAVTSTDRVAQQLTLVYGVKSYVRPDEKMQATKLTNWLQRHKILKEGDVVVTCSGQRPGVVGTTDTIKVRIL